MSKTGKLLRGLKWYSWRDVDGVLPSEISSDDDKMCDVDFYLDFVKGKDSKVVNKVLLSIRHYERGMTKSGTMMKGTKKVVSGLKVELDSIKPKEEKPVKDASKKGK